MTKGSQGQQDSLSINNNEEVNRVCEYARDMLKDETFIGTFFEKQLVDSLNAYRDVVRISDDEVVVIKTLKAVRHRCKTVFPENVWIGISEPAKSGCNIWVTLSTEVFGTYTFTIKNIQFNLQEVILSVDVGKSASDDKITGHDSSPWQILEDVSQNHLGEVGLKIGKFLNQKLRDLFSETLTWSNIKEAVVFIFLLISTLITFGIYAINYLLDYSLKFMNELSHLVTACTPIVLGCFRMIMNAINGFYTLIVILWRGQSYQGGNEVHQMPQIPYHNMKALPYTEEHYAPRRYKSSVKITPLD